ncbi:nucleoside hydrolase [Pelomyxa schiedti]|nr:nucleoside hydrolase [Pelomyxa schiedti]
MAATTETTSTSVQPSSCDNVCENNIMDVVFDMETSDPDDFITLLLLGSHPRVNLKAVTISPGSVEQVRLVKFALRELGLTHTVIGSFDRSPKPKVVSGWHYKAFGTPIPTGNDDSLPAWQVLLDCCDMNTTLITGAPLKNLGQAIQKSNSGKPLTIGRWVCQGGFAGEGVVPPDLQMKKFRGLKVCPTFNFGGAPQAALAGIAYPGITRKLFVSKNVCHRVVYDNTMHNAVKAAVLAAQSASSNPLSSDRCKRRLRGLQLIEQGMTEYLKTHPGKMMHDPLAATAALNESVITWAEVEFMREKGAWGTVLAPGSGKWIAIDYNHELFIQTFTEL